MNATTTTYQPKVGDIFVNSWGYDQTNIDYYAVRTVSKSGKTVTVQQVKAANLGSDGYGSDTLTPTLDAFTQPRWARLDPDFVDGAWTAPGRGDRLPDWVAPIKRKTIRTWGSEPSLSMDHGWCGLWDGDTDRATSSGWGH